ncbi:MAG TPA: urate hydroxylase PuuD [Xanthomonadales bacterium]|nr:urate hydroxylase PuuD [Xanthomonadales bacterium]
MELALLQGNALAFLFRWIHLLAGVAWIGLLWYFNFIQGEYFKEADASSKSDAIRKLVPRALWWFRWGAVFTLLSGILLLGVTHRMGYGIIVGAALGTLMFLNVWLIIWPNQKIVVASAEKVAAGGEANPAAASALAKAGLASRTNTLFSIPMLFFMASSMHLQQLAIPVASASVWSKVAVFGLILLLEINAVKGKTGPITTVKGVIHMGLLLTLVLYLGVDVLS